MITFRNVTKNYGSVMAVDDISFEIQSFELFVIIGPSGSGKTTAMKMINRLHEVSEGEIYIDDEAISDIDPVELRRRIGYVIQDVGLMPHMTIAENIGIIHRLLGKKLSGERLDELLNLVNMDPEDFKNRYPDELSGGQKQRIGVIRALANDPNIILMDEPFSALDPVSREELQDEFKRLQEKVNKTIIFVTHDIDEALKLGDRICLMRDGRVEQLGTPEELLFSPKNDFVRRFIGEDRLQSRTFKDFTLEDWMELEPVHATRGMKVDEAMELMRSHRKGILPVMDERRLLGTVSIWQLVVSKEETIDAEIQSDGVIEIPSDSSVTETLNLIHGSEGKPGVVMEGERLVGMLDYNRLIESLSTREKETEKAGES